jgi:hypothetical protein
MTFGDSAPKQGRQQQSMQAKRCREASQPDGRPRVGRWICQAEVACFLLNHGMIDRNQTGDSNCYDMLSEESNIRSLIEIKLPLPIYYPRDGLTDPSRFTTMVLRTVESWVRSSGRCRALLIRSDRAQLGVRV